MKSILSFSIALILCMNFCYSQEYFTWEVEPKQNELIMCVFFDCNAPPEHRQTLLVTHYRDTEAYLYKFQTTSWEKVTPEKLYRWCNEGSRLIYIP